MTITISETGHVFIPQIVRDHQGLRPGDGIELEEVPGKVILSKIVKHEGKSLVDHLLACPHYFEIPERDPNDTVGA